MFPQIARIIAELIAHLVLLLAPQKTTTVIITATVVPTVTQQVYQIEGIDSWLAQSNWPQWTWPTVKRIVYCESRGIVGIATNPPHVGLMQVNTQYWGRVNADPVSELNQGYEVYKIQGFGAWSCY